MTKSKGLKCPLCGSWYSEFANDPDTLDSGMRVGDVCGNQSMKGTNPKKCSPDHPCPGRVVRVGADYINPFDPEVIKKAFEEE